MVGQSQHAQTMVDVQGKSHRPSGLPDRKSGRENKQVRRRGLSSYVFQSFLNILPAHFLLPDVVNVYDDGQELLHVWGVLAFAQWNDTLMNIASWLSSSITRSTRTSPGSIVWIVGLPIPIGNRLCQSRAKASKIDSTSQFFSSDLVML